jgi:hypothetical protein
MLKGRGCPRFFTIFFAGRGVVGVGGWYFPPGARWTDQGGFQEALGVASVPAPPMAPSHAPRRPTPALARCSRTWRPRARRAVAIPQAFGVKISKKVFWG